MKTKKFELKNLENAETIIVSSEDKSIDFIKENSLVVVHVGSLSKPRYQLRPEIYVLETNQPQTTVFELPIRGENIKVEITVFSNCDIDKITVQLNL